MPCRRAALRLRACAPAPACAATLTTSSFRFDPTHPNLSSVCRSSRLLYAPDGTYLVVWKPTTSGQYTVTISHFGITLMGVPFLVRAANSLPCAARCTARGDALQSAVSRMQQHFEIMFKDRLNQTASAVELDVFVEPLPPNSPRTRREVVRDPAREEAEQTAWEHAERHIQAAKRAQQQMHEETMYSGKSRKNSKKQIDLVVASAVNAFTSGVEKRGIASMLQSMPKGLEQQQQFLGEAAERKRTVVHTEPIMKLERKKPPAPVAPDAADDDPTAAAATAPTPTEKGAATSKTAPTPTAQAAATSKTVPTPPAPQPAAQAAAASAGLAAGLDLDATQVGSSQEGATDAEATAAEDDAILEGGVRYRTVRVRVEKVLIVRTGCSLESKSIGKLYPGQIVTVIEERFPEGRSGEVFGCIALDSIGDSLDGSQSNRGDESHRGRDASAGGEAAGKPLTPFTSSATQPPAGVPPLQPPAAQGMSADGGQAASEASGMFTGWVQGGGAGGSNPPTLRKSGPDSGRKKGTGSPSGKRMAAVPGSPKAQGAFGGIPLGSGRLARMGSAGGGLSSFRGGSGRPITTFSASNSSRRGQVGWILLMKDRMKLVTSRVQLGPDSRRNYSRQWERRIANDKRVKESRGKTDDEGGSAGGARAPQLLQQDREKALASLKLELDSDPAGIGFAFGGVDPGTLHAKGQLHEVHKVHYSIGLAGEYFLHVRLRQKAQAIAGSPFRLTVLPGPAHARSTRLSSDAMRGLVGLDAGSAVGVHQTLYTADKMGNLCVKGGASVTIAAWRGKADFAKAKAEDLEMVQTSVVDKGDGSYKLEWKSTFSGTFTTRVMVDGDDVKGSPRTFALTSSSPEISKTLLEGSGLEKAIAGTVAEITASFFDQFNNKASPTEDFKFFMAFDKGKAKLSEVEPAAFEGEWREEGVYSMTYVATESGPCKLHVWCDPSSKDERVAFPGSPFSLVVAPGAASTDVSQVTGWSKLQKEEKNAKFSKNAATDPNALVAGDTIMIRPEIFDQYGNATVLSEGSLEVIHEIGTSKEKATLRFTQQQIRGTELFQYDVRHDTQVSGDHAISLEIGGVAIKGSPVTFRVQPDKPDPQSCKLSGPLDVESNEALDVDKQYTFLLRTYDKYSNHCWVGGHKFGTRLQLIKQNAHDQTALVPQNHTLESVDLGDGTYHILVTLNFPCSVKLFANLDKNLPASAGELPPLTLNFVKLDDASDSSRQKRKSLTEAPRNVAEAPASAGSAKGSARGAGEDHTPFLT